MPKIGNPVGGLAHKPQWAKDIDAGIDRRSAWASLTTLARTINPTLPADLSGHVLTITMSKHGVSAVAQPVHKPDGREARF